MASYEAEFPDGVCVLCGQQPECIATHFDLCFAAHCPTAAPVGAAPLRPPRTEPMRWLGSWALPPDPASFFRACLSVPDRLACACTSRSCNEFVASDDEWNSA